MKCLKHQKQQNRLLMYLFQHGIECFFFILDTKLNIILASRDLSMYFSVKFSENTASWENKLNWISYIWKLSKLKISWIWESFYDVFYKDINFIIFEWTYTTRAADVQPYAPKEKPNTPKTSTCPVMVGKKSPIEKTSDNWSIIIKVSIKIFDGKMSIIFPVIILPAVFINPEIPRMKDVCIGEIPRVIAWSELYISPPLMGWAINTKI